MICLNNSYQVYYNTDQYYSILTMNPMPSACLPAGRAAWVSGEVVFCPPGSYYLHYGICEE